MAKRAKRKLSEEDGLWLTNVEFNGRSDKAYVKSQLNALAEKIACYRRDQGYSQETLAELTCVSVATIKFIEQKQRVPSLVVLLKIMNVVDKDAVLWK